MKGCDIVRIPLEATKAIDLYPYMTYIGIVTKIKNIIDLHTEAKKRGHTLLSPNKSPTATEEIIYIGNNKFFRLKDNKAEIFEDKLLVEITLKLGEIEDIDMLRNILRHVMRVRNSKV